MGKALRVGIIGTGRAGQCHAAAFLRIPDVAVTALWNRTRSRAEKLAAKLDQPDVQVYDDWLDLIERGQVDIVSIATAPILRSAPFAAALARGHHVLVEKPLSVGLPEAQEMTQLAGKAQTVTAISLNWRYSPGCLTARRAVQEGQIGPILDLREAWQMPYNPVWSAEMSGSLRDFGSHEFDRARFLTGWDFRRVVSCVRWLPEKRAPGSTEDDTPQDASAFVLAEMSDQGLSTFRLALTPGQRHRQITICGEKGTLTLTTDWQVYYPEGENAPGVTLSNELRVVRQRVDDSLPVTLEIAAEDRQEPDTLSGQHTWNRLITDFITAVRNSDLKHVVAPLLPHIADGLATQRVIVACEQSHIERRWVELE